MTIRGTRREAGTVRSSSAHRLGEGLVQQRLAVEVEQVEEEERHRELVPHALDLEPATEAPHGGLKGQRRPVGAKRDGLPLEDQLARGERPHRIDQLGHGGGDFVEPAGIDPHLVAAPVDLHPGAVQLVFDRGLPQLAERLGDGLRAPRQHRKHGLEQSHGEGGEARAVAVQRGARDRRKIARHHERASDLSGRTLGRRGDCLDHEPLQGALPELAHDEAGEEALFFLGESCQELTQESLPGVRRALARRARDGIERGIHLRELDLGSGRGGARQGALNGGPSEAELVLPHGPRDVGGRDLDLLRRRVREEPGEEPDLLPPAAGLGEAPGGCRQPSELHRRPTRTARQGIGAAPAAVRVPRASSPAILPTKRRPSAVKAMLSPWRRTPSSRTESAVPRTS